MEAYSAFASVRMQRWPHPQENGERDRQFVAVIALEPRRYVIDRELAAKTDVQSVAVREVAHVTDGVGVDRENVIVIAFLQDQLVAGFLDPLEAAVNRVAAALIIGFEQER